MVKRKESKTENLATVYAVLIVALLIFFSFDEFKLTKLEKENQELENSLLLCKFQADVFLRVNVDKSVMNQSNYYAILYLDGKVNESDWSSFQNKTNITVYRK